MALSGSGCLSPRLFIFSSALRGQGGEGDTQRQGRAQRGQAGGFRGLPSSRVRGARRDKVPSVCNFSVVCVPASEMSSGYQRACFCVCALVLTKPKGPNVTF